MREVPLRQQDYRAGRGNDTQEAVPYLKISFHDGDLYGAVR